MNSQIISTRYYSIPSNLETEPIEYKDIESAIKASNFLAVKEKFGTFERKSGEIICNNKFIDYEFYFNINDDSSKKWQLNHWEFEYIESVSYYGHDRTAIQIQFTDPHGAIRKIISSYSGLKKKIYPYLKLFKRYASEKDLRTADLMIENENLHLEVIRLKQRIAELEQK